jgi:hypothetical protein
VIALDETDGLHFRPDLQDSRGTFDFETGRFDVTIVERFS